MPLKCLAWNPQPGSPLPDPLLADDSESFDVDTVKWARQWLASIAPAFELREPTPIVIHAPAAINHHVPETLTAPASVEYLGMPKTIGGHYFKSSTAEILLRDRHRKIEAKYRYLVARSGAHVILGPKLGNLQQVQL